MDVVDVAIDDLRPDSANPRRISPEQAEALTRSLERYVRDALTKAGYTPVVTGDPEEVVFHSASGWPTAATLPYREGERK